MTVPTGQTIEMKLVEMQHESMPEAHPGDNEGPNLKNAAVKDLMRGTWLWTRRTIGRKTAFFTVVDCRTSHISVNNAKILTKVDRRWSEKEPKLSKYEDVGFVMMIPSEEPTILECAYSRFVQVILKELWEHGDTRFVEVLPSEKERKFLEYGDSRFVEMIPS